MILVDTSIPVSLIRVGHPHHKIAIDAMDLLQRRDSEQFAIAPQILYEMYVVCTRPAAANGLGLSASSALRELIATRGLFFFLRENENVYQIWESLLAKNAVLGKRTHDLHVAALMIHHGLSRILTFNDADFRSFTEIEPLNPFDVLSIPRS